MSLCAQVFIFSYYSQSDISILHFAAPLVAAVVAVAVTAAAAAAAAVAVAAAAAVTVPAAAAAIAVTPTDLMRFRPRYLIFLDCTFHYSLEI